MSDHIPGWDRVGMIQKVYPEWDPRGVCRNCQDCGILTHKRYPRCALCSRVRARREGHVIVKGAPCSTSD